jgi:hypothetical protein
MTGGTFSTNGGTFGSILYAHLSRLSGRARGKGALHGGKRPSCGSLMNYFICRHDHHAIDGREAVLGLAMKETLEDPAPAVDIYLPFLLTS